VWFIEKQEKSEDSQGSEISGLEHPFGKIFTCKIFSTHTYIYTQV